MINEIYPRKLTQLTYITFTTFVSIVSYLEQTFFSRKYFDVFIFVGGYPDNCPPRKNASRLGLGFWSRLRLVLGLRGGRGEGEKPDNCPRRKQYLSQSHGLDQTQFWGWVAILLGDNCPRTLWEVFRFLKYSSSSFVLTRASSFGASQTSILVCTKS